MNRSYRVILASLTAVSALGLTACGSGELAKTSGLRDGVKYLPAVKAVKAKTHQGTAKQDETERYCKTYKKNSTSCKTYGTRKTGRTITVPVTVTDAPGKPGKPAMWCVELDNVGGDQDRDDRWFEVPADVYNGAADKNEGAKITDMEYLREVAACKR